MKRKLIITTALLVGAFALTVPAKADHRPRFGLQLGFGHGGGYIRVGINGGSGHHHGPKRKHQARYEHKRPLRTAIPYARPYPGRYVSRNHSVHSCVRTPVYRRVWVDPVYRRVFDGFDRWGQRVYRGVLVRSGYFRQVLSHYRCGRCGVTYLLTPR